ncbi:hypothetical protein CDD83_9862 [Cordyceps sp. RAO-2017]|nr:hypothetical protein CDD83_9862 [Cordyceps sp. RAO-2017]
MGGRQIRPARVYQNVLSQMETAVLPGHRTYEPPWFQVLNTIPPAESLVRTVSPCHRRPDPRAKGTPNLFRPQKLQYLEDALRTIFYRDHPWELARPRVILESDGKDHQRRDWSTGVRQPGMPLTGECVVQRQMWLMQNQKLNKRQAYDKARKEFYRLRQAEEIEVRVAQEEARYVGAYFGLSKLDVGMGLEDRDFESWKAWAAEQLIIHERRDQAGIDTFEVEEEPDQAGGEARVVAGALPEASA